MDKVNITLQIPENVVVTFGKTSVEVKPFLSENEQELLITSYLEDLFDFSRAEMFLMTNIIDVCTSIPLTEGEGDNMRLLVTQDELYANFSFYKQVVSKIINYDDFRNKLDKAVEEKYEQRRLAASLGSVVDNLYEKVSSLLSELSGGLTDEKIAQLKGLLADANNSPILKSVVGQLGTKDAAAPVSKATHKGNKKA